MSLSLISNKLYSWQEFLTLSFQQIDKLQWKRHNKIFKLGTSFLSRDRTKAIKRIESYLNEKILAFAVEDKDKKIVTVWHEIPCEFEYKPDTAILKLDSISSSTESKNTAEVENIRLEIDPQPLINPNLPQKRYRGRFY